MSTHPIPPNFKCAIPALCGVCSLRYRRHAPTAKGREGYLLWRDYVEDCNDCDRFGRDPMPWSELFPSGRNRIVI